MNMYDVVALGTDERKRDGAIVGMKRKSKGLPILQRPWQAACKIKKILKNFSRYRSVRKKPSHGHVGVFY